jgi:hypothetical protein
VKFLRPLWIALRTSVIGTAVAWVAILTIDKSGWEIPPEAAQPLVFFVVLFFGVLLTRKRG